MKKNRAGFVLGAILATIALCMPVCADEARHIPVGQFSQQKMDDWQAKKFVGETRYTITRVGGEFVLRADSHAAASGLIRRIRVDLDQTPYLNWRWRIEQPLAGDYDEKTRAGDDYAARVYVVVSGGFAFWNTRALNYVWARHSARGEIWPNAFAPENAIMMALRTAQDPESVWHSEKRNVRDDLKKLFKTSIRFIDAVVLMTDTDNTENRATAVYGDIYFSGQ